MRRDDAISYGIIAGTVIAALIGGLLVWLTISRWWMVAQIQSAQDAAWAGRLEDARRLARSASDWSAQPVSVALTVDLTAADAAERLTALRSQVSPTDQRLLSAWIALRSGTREARDALDADDVPWMSAIDAWKQDKAVPLPTTTPSFPLWHAAQDARLRMAQTSGSAELLRSALSSAIMATPRHPDYAVWVAVIAGLTGDATEVTAKLNAISGEQRALAERWVRAVAPHTLALIAPPPAVESLGEDPAPTLAERVAQVRALAKQNPTLAAKLVARMPAQEQPRMRLAMCEITGDATQTIAAIKACALRIVVVNRTTDTVTFDAVLADGSTPLVSLDVKVNGVVQNARLITRLGQRFTAPLTIKGAVAMELRYADQTVAQGVAP